MGDDFLRLLLCRHIFASCVLRAHRSFRGRGAPFQPSSRPQLPDLDLIENPTLQRYALDLAAQLDVRHLFVDSCGEVDWWRPQVGVGGATTSYPIVQIGAHEARVRDGTVYGGGGLSWNQPRRPNFHHQPTAYNTHTLIPQPTADLYMGSAGISNVMGRRRHYSGAGIMSVGGGGGGIGMGGRLGYGGTYSSSINTLNNLSSSYPTPYMNPALTRQYPSHHSTSFSSLPMMVGSPTGHHGGLSHANSLLGNFGATSLYRRYPSSTTFLNTTDHIGWRRWLKAPTFNVTITIHFFLSWPKTWTNCVLFMIDIDCGS